MDLGKFIPKILMNMQVKNTIIFKKIKEHSEFFSLWETFFAPKPSEKEETSPKFLLKTSK